MIRSSLLVTFGSCLSLLTGFISQVVIAWYFGTSVQMDAFMTAIVIPLYLQALLLTGLPFVLVPMFVNACETAHESEAWAIVGTMLRLFGVSLSVCAVVCYIFSPQIISLTAPGLSSGANMLASKMFAILIFDIPFAALGTLSNSIQNARGRFFWPAAAPAIGALVNVFLIIVGYKHFGAIVLAWGALVSTIVQSSFSALPVIKLSWNRTVSLKDPRLKKMMSLLLPIILFGLIGRATPVFERYFASGLPQGSISYLGYALKISIIVQALLGTGISTAIFPDMARAYATDGKKGLAPVYLKAMRLTWVSSLPCVAIGSIVSLPLVQVLFQRGNFTYESAVNTAIILPFIMGIVMSNILGCVIGRALYVQGKTFGLSLIGAISITLYPLFAFLTVPSMGYVGLALTGLAVNLIGLAGGYYLLWRELGIVETPYLSKYSSCALICSLATWFALRIEYITANPFITLLFSGCLGFIVYGLCLMRVDSYLVNELIVRISRVFSKKITIAGEPNVS